MNTDQPSAATQLEIPPGELDTARDALARTVQHGREAADDLTRQRRRVPTPPADFLADFERTAKLGRLSANLAERRVKSGAVRFSGPPRALAWLAEDLVWKLAETLSDPLTPDRFVRDGDTGTAHRLIERMAHYRAEYHRLDRAAVAAIVASVGRPARFERETQSTASSWTLTAQAVPDGDRWTVHYHGEAIHRPAAGGAGESRDAILRTAPERFDSEPSAELLTDLARRALGLLEIDCGNCDGAGEIYFESGDGTDGYYDPCPDCDGTGRQLLGKGRD